MNNRRTNKEIKKLIKDCIMNNNDIFNIKAIMKHTGLMRETVMAHKNEVMNEFRNNVVITENLKNLVNNK